MHFDLQTLEANRRYKLLTALVIPRPIAWVTTLNTDGSLNAAPYSFFNVLGNQPPLVALGPHDKAPGELKDTVTNILREKEFVINLADKSGASLLHQTAAPFPPEESEVSALDLQTIPSQALRTPRLEIAPVHLECRYHSSIHVGDNRVLFGVVEHLHAPDEWVNPENHHVKPGAFQAIGRLQGPGWYCAVEEPFDLGRFPSVDQIRSRKA